MLTTAAFNVAKGVRANMRTVTQLHEDVWVARGALRFPQGLQVIYDLFAGKHLADAYSHPFLIEKEYWPEQPSPQFQLTEEIQSVMQVMKGMTYMQDKGTHLDNTMTLLRNPADHAEFAIFNPCELNEASIETIKVAIGEKGTVTKIIVPTRQTWQSVETWKHLYPAAHLIVSGGVPERYTKAGADRAEVARLRWKESDPEGYERSEMARIDALKPAPEPKRFDTPISNKKTKSAAMTASGNRITAPTDYLGIVPERRPKPYTTFDYSHLRTNYGENQAKTSAHNKYNRADFFENASFEMERNARDEQSKKDAAPDAPPREDVDVEASPELADGVHIIPEAGMDIFGASRLHHVRGDRTTNEFVLFHEASGLLACTDLYHGGYTDYDPMNTWLCRVWFKLQRQGDYKSATVLPAYRRLALEKTGQMAEMQRGVDELTRALDIRSLSPAHGSGPLTENCGGLIREMYGLGRR
jgi:hypothetical protein